MKRNIYIDLEAEIAELQKLRAPNKTKIRPFGMFVMKACSWGRPWAFFRKEGMTPPEMQRVRIVQRQHHDTPLGTIRVVHQFIQPGTPIDITKLAAINASIGQTKITHHPDIPVDTTFTTKHTLKIRTDGRIFGTVARHLSAPSTGAENQTSSPEQLSQKMQFLEQSSECSPVSQCDLELLVENLNQFRNWLHTNRT